MAKRLAGMRSNAKAPVKSRPANRSKAAKAQAQEEALEAANAAQFVHDQTPDAASVISESIVDDDVYAASQPTSSRKRKREEPELNRQDIEHQNWADALLDYFMLADSDDRFPAPPTPPDGINLDRPIDEKGHTALHWAAAMGDVDVVKTLVEAGAKVDMLSNNLETPLMRAVMFTNNYDKQTMAKLVRALAGTVFKTDWFGSTVFHHIAATTSSKNKYLPARYYMDTIINALSETWRPDELIRILNQQDHNGDTAIHIAARHGARKCVRSLLGRNVSVDIRNQTGETADEMIRDLNARRRLHSGAGTRGREASSSPFGPDRTPMNGDTALVGAISGLSDAHYRSQTAHTLLNRLVPTFMAKLRLLATAFESEFSEKEIEAIENEAVIKKRVAEIEALKKQMAEQTAALEELQTELEAAGTTCEEEEEQQEDELRRLEAEALSLLELEQRDSLERQMTKAGVRRGANRPRNAAAAAEAEAQASMGPPPRTPNGVVSERRTLISKLADAQMERQRMTREIVRSLGAAGLGERHAEYKKLIHTALNIREQEVDSMLDEILGQLEEDRRDQLVAGQMQVPPWN
jgi:transcription factor MBP1